MASQEAIKELGTNGGGFFNANSAHPFENPDAWINMLEIWSLLLIPVALGARFRPRRRRSAPGRAILITMAILLVVGVVVLYAAEAVGNPLLTALGVDPSSAIWRARRCASGRP